MNRRENLILAIRAAECYHILGTERIFARFMQIGRRGRERETKGKDLTAVFGVRSASLLRRGNGKRADRRDPARRARDGSGQSPVVGDRGFRSRRRRIGIVREAGVRGKTEVVLERDLLVCIDPGHGFEDGGSGASEASFYPDGTLEKDVTITVAGLLKNALEKEGFRTVMTHDGESIPAEYNWDGNDIFNPNERVALMNTLDPDYIVSLHTNAAANPDAHGVQIYYDHVSDMKENDWNEPAVEMIARTIDERMGFGEEDATALRNLVNAENGSLAVTRDSRAAAVLIELGFSTNEENAKNLIDPEWQADIADAVAEGVGRFFDSMGMTAKESERPVMPSTADGTADTADSSDSADPDSVFLSPFGAVDWRFENGKYIYDFPPRNTEGLAAFDEMVSFPTTRFEDANKPPQVDNWFPGQVFYDESTGETSYGWDRWDSTKEVFKKYGAIYRGDESRKVCYLTFDCGYEIGMTASLLDTLKEKQAPGTFFVTGPFVRGESADFTKEYMHSLTRRMLDEGHGRALAQLRLRVCGSQRRPAAQSAGRIVPAQLIPL